jgi:glutamate formiminotransferase/formiminotetrahydrofolate cyclodeaminase
MAAPLDFSSQNVGDFCDTISAETSAPGGGSVAAVVGAMGASLTAMAARFSKEQWEDAAGAVAQAEALKARLLPLADEDARAYETVLLALRMPRDVDVDDDVRDAAIGDALSRATDVPLAIAEASLDVATLACELAERGNPNLHGDAAAAVFLSESAVRTCANLVEINLATQEGDERLDRARELVERVRRISRRVLEPTG